MAHFRIQQARISALKLPKGYERDKINIGVPATEEEYRAVGLQNVGDVVLPSAGFGPACAKNANGYTFVDRTKPPEYRYVSTVWNHPYGNKDARPVPMDMYRTCLARTEIPPTEIELMLVEDAHGCRYVVADLTPEVREKYLKEAVNLFLEIYGYCHIFQDAVDLSEQPVRQRCNWRILPPGELPSVHLIKHLIERGLDADTFDVSRLSCVEGYMPEKIVEGVNGFDGYFAYIFRDHCVLESAVYGNATYIIPKKDWEVLSQMKKRELTDNHLVERKIIHSQSWYEQFDLAMQEPKPRPNEKKS